MKKIQIILLILLVSFAYSCDDDGGTSVIDLGNDGAVPDMAKSDTGDSFIDLVKITNGENVTIAINADVAQGTPAMTDIVGSYKTADGEVYNGVLISDVSLPQTFDITVDDIVAAFSEFNDPTDILLGDILTISTRFTMDDGVVLNIFNEDGSFNISADLQNSGLFTTFVNYPVACPSEIGGTFDFVSTNLQADFGGPCPIGEVTGTVTWTDQGGGNYLSTDLGFGQYESSCWNDGPATSAGAIVVDLCNEINPGQIGGLDQYGLTYIYTIISVDGSVLTLSWANDYADSGDVVLTRQDGLDWPPVFTSN